MKNKNLTFQQFIKKIEKIDVGELLEKAKGINVQDIKSMKFSDLKNINVEELKSIKFSDLKNITKSD